LGNKSITNSLEKAKSCHGCQSCQKSDVSVTSRYSWHHLQTKA